MREQEATPWVTADSLIEAFGDEAYQKGLTMAVESLQAGDKDASRAISQANIELIKRGYHKRGYHKKGKP